MTAEPSQIAPRRIDAIDIARGAALLAMAVYHFAWDLEFFGYADPGMTARGGWKIFARCIASSFLFLVGVSLFLAHGRGIRWQGFSRRWLAVAGAAALISVATWFATPQTFIFFGILHHIALASFLGLAFLRLPAWATLLAAGLIFAAPFALESAAFDHPALWWLGLSAERPRSNDYVPLLPWFGAVLTGLAAARLAERAGVLKRLARLPVARAAAPLAFAGRHSLAVYLIHQPVLIGLLWLFALVAPPTVSPERVFRDCEAGCTASRDGEFCMRYCTCMLSELEQGGMLKPLTQGANDADTQSRLREAAGFCSIQAESGFPDAP